MKLLKIWKVDARRFYVSNYFLVWMLRHKMPLKKERPTCDNKNRRRKKDILLFTLLKRKYYYDLLTNVYATFLATLFVRDYLPSLSPRTGYRERLSLFQLLCIFPKKDGHRATLWKRLVRETTTFLLDPLKYQVSQYHQNAFDIINTNIVRITVAQRKKKSIPYC